MSIETEVKIKIEDSADFCRRMTALKPEILSARHFEDNMLFDFPDRRLSFSQCLLRVRLTEKLSYLTFKGPARQDGIFKTREELEAGLDNGPAVIQVLNRIGMHVCFQYQKYRQEFELDGVHVAIDETPIGNYVELEGAEEGIRNLALKVGIAESQFLRSSYYSLYVEHCQAKGETPKFMIF